MHLAVKLDHCSVQRNIPSESIKGQKLPQNHQNQKQTGRRNQRHPHEPHVSRHPLDRDATRNKRHSNKVSRMLKQLQPLHLRAEEIQVWSDKRVVEHLDKWR